MFPLLEKTTISPLLVNIPSIGFGAPTKLHAANEVVSAVGVVVVGDSVVAEDAKVVAECVVVDFVPEAVGELLLWQSWRLVQLLTMVVENLAWRVRLKCHLWIL